MSAAGAIDGGCHVGTGRVAALDYLRGFAAASVALPHFFIYHAFHSDAFEAASALGVEIFFVLSGYVLASQLLYVMSEQQPRVLGIFLVRRWMRTIPAYVVALCFISVMLGKIGAQDFYRYLFYVQNLFQQSNKEDYFAVAWSLSVEEWFYLVFPLVLLVAAAVSRLKDVRAAALIAAIMFIVVISACRLFLPDMDDWGPSVRRVVFFRIDSIAFGFVLYILLQDGRLSLARALGVGWAVVGLALFGVISFWLAFEAANGVTFAKHLFPFTAAVFGGCGITLAVKLEKIFVRAPRAAAVGIALGTFSYSIYLFHSIILIVLGSLLGRQSILVHLAIYAVLLTGFAAAFYHTFEKPILALRPSYRARRRAAVAIAPAATASVAATADRLDNLLEEVR